jgi:hypothetical protein
MGSHEEAAAALAALDTKYTWEGMASPILVKWMDTALQKRRRDQHMAATASRPDPLLLPMMGHHMSPLPQVTGISANAQTVKATLMGRGGPHLQQAATGGVHGSSAPSADLRGLGAISATTIVHAVEEPKPLLETPGSDAPGAAGLQYALKSGKVLVWALCM